MTQLPDCGTMFEFMSMHKSKTISRLFFVDSEAQNGLKIHVVGTKLDAICMCCFTSCLLLFGCFCFTSTNARTLKPSKTNGGPSFLDIQQFAPQGKLASKY